MILRFRLRSVLLLLSLSVFILPMGGIYLLRIYESALVRQTQSELNAQAVVLASAFRRAYLDHTLDAIEAYGGPILLRSPENKLQSIDLAKSPIYPPIDPYHSQQQPVPIAELTGANLASVVEDTNASQFTNIRITDHQGVIVASSNEDLGASIQHIEDIQNALAGAPQSRIRSRPVDPVIALFSPASAIRVSVARPIIHINRVLGVVFLQKAPATILQALYGKRNLLIQTAGVIIIAALMVAIFAARTVVSPIKRLAHDVDSVAHGKTQSIGRERPYRTIEVDQLATRIREMAATLQKRTGYLSNLARHVSHEFKTPITAITAAIEVLQEHSESMTAKERNRFFQNIEDDLKHLGALTEGLLELARADMSIISGQTTSLDGLNLPGASISGETETAMQIDADSLNAVLSQLTNNAKQNGASNISINAKRNEDYICITVRDDGIGISTPNAHRVFDPFFTTNRNSGGTGLGLPIARALAENAGGTLELLETADGTVFETRIPIATTLS